MLERNIFLLGRSSSTFQNYSRHVAAMALPFQCLPTELDPEQVKDYRDRGAVKLMTLRNGSLQDGFPSISCRNDLCAHEALQQF
jgi:hypothetical protein